jgi:hypothetical protein
LKQLSQRKPEPKPIVYGLKFGIKIYVILHPSVSNRRHTFCREALPRILPASRARAKIVKIRDEVILTFSHLKLNLRLTLVWVEGIKFSKGWPAVVVVLVVVVVVDKILRCTVRSIK